MMNRSLFRGGVLIATLVLPGQRALAQIPLPDQVYQLFFSSSTPPQYKRIVSQLIRMNDLAAGRPVKPASLLPATTPALSTVSVSAQVLAADPTFTFHDFYSFPNPVRGQNTVTLRVQPGLADSVEVRVYDLSGRRVYASSSFNNRGAFDDGNGLGPQFTYDHVWDVSGIGSGVYRYVVTAKKAGQTDIAKSGKVAVVK